MQTVMVRVSEKTKERIKQIARERALRDSKRVTQTAVVDELVTREWRALFWPGTDETSRPVAAKEQTNV